MSTAGGLLKNTIVKTAIPSAIITKPLHRTIKCRQQHSLSRVCVGGGGIVRGDGVGGNKTRIHTATGVSLSSYKNGDCHNDNAVRTASKKRLLPLNQYPTPRHTTSLSSPPSSSSSSPPPKDEIRITDSISSIDYLQQITSRIIETPRGSLSQGSIHELKVSISSWHSRLISDPSVRETLSSASLSGMARLAPERAEALLRRLVDEFEYYHGGDGGGDGGGGMNDREKGGGVPQKTTPAGVDIDVDTVNLVLDCWRISLNTEHACATRSRSSTYTQQHIENSPLTHRCHDLLQFIRAAYLRHHPAHPPSSFEHPNTKSYNIALDTYAKRGLPTPASTLLTSMTQLSLHHSLPNLRPDLISYNSLIAAHANHPSDPIQAARSAHDTLLDLFSLYELSDHLPELRPDRVSFATVLTAYARSAAVDPTAARKAEDLLRRMIALYETGSCGEGEGEWGHLAPSTVCYTCVIDAWAKSGVDCAADRAVDLLGCVQGMDGSSSGDGDGGEGYEAGAGVVGATAVIDAYAKSAGEDHVEKAEALLDRMINAYEHDSFHANGISNDGDGNGHGGTMVKPNTVTFTAFINCLAQQAGRTHGGDGGMNALRAEAVLRKMEDLYGRTGDENVRPNAYTYNAVINAWAKGRREDAGERAEEWLRKMEDGECGSWVDSNSITYASAIHAYAKSAGQAAAAAAADGGNRRGRTGSRQSSSQPSPSHNNNSSNNNGERAERLLNRLIERSQNAPDSSDSPNIPQPTTVHFAATIDAYASSHQPHHALRVLQSIKDLYQSSNPPNPSIQPDSFCYNTAIHALAMTGNPKGLHQAEELLEEMLQLGLAQDVTFATIIEGFARSGAAGAVEKAEALLDRMWALAEKQDGNTHLQPTIVTYNSLINAIAKSRNSNSAKSALRILHRLESQHQTTPDPIRRPNTITYNAVLSALASNSSHHHHHTATNLQAADKLLTDMHTLHSSGRRPDVQPDVFTLTTLISLHSYSDRPDSAQRAEDLLQQMHALYEGGNKRMRPTVVAFGAVLHAWARVGDGERAQAIVDHMEQLPAIGDGDWEGPNAVVYNTLINAWAKSADGDGVQRAQAVLEKMRASERMECQPNRISYNSVLAAYLKVQDRDAVHKAERLLSDMERDGIAPDVVTYTTLLNVVANNRHPQNITKAAHILKEMEARAVPPNFMTYHTIIKMCALLTNTDSHDRHDLQREALLLAVTAYTKIKQFQQQNQSPKQRRKQNHHQQPTLSSHTYNCLFTVLIRFSSNDDERTRLVLKTLNDCCADGLLTNSILQNIQRSIQHRLLQTVLDPDRTLRPHQLKVEALPSDWSRFADRRVRSKSHRDAVQTKHQTGRRKIPNT